MADEGSAKKPKNSATTLVLLSSAHVVMTQEAAGRIHRYRRTNLAFATIAEANLSYAQVLEICDRMGRTGRGLLIDSRDAPGRNDPAFEAALLEFSRRALPGYAAVAILLKTAMGRLQAQRFERQRSSSHLVTDDEAAAIAYLLAAAQGPLPR